MATETEHPRPERETAPFRYTATLAGEIETRWQVWWEERGTYHVPNPGEPGFDASRPKFYCLDMFPYPSGAGLHVGHPEGYTATDIICRYKRMQGFNVLHPMGWDAFGLPAEQYAIQTGVHPAVTTRSAIDNFRRQLKRFGFSYDWSREFGTIDPDYYRWTQWIFLKVYDAWFDPEQERARPISELVAEFEADTREVRLNPAAAEYTGAGDIPGGTRVGAWADLDAETRRMIVDSYRLAYVARQTVNWCPKLGTALANEEVIDGKSERGGYPVFRKPMRQWMFRITAYADRLLAGLDGVEWPESTKTLQANWIGRSEGAEIDFAIVDADGVPMGPALRVFTTRPDTIFGATYMVVAPEHPLVDEALEYPGRETDEAALRAYVEQARNRSDVERMEGKEKTGVATGISVMNPATGRPIPVWTSDYVLMSYGTGAIMAVPAQDQRDWDFAKAFGLPIVRTVQPTEGFEGEAYVGDGPAVNSGFLDGLFIGPAKRRIIDWLESQHVGMRKVHYRLRDWLFSRQRYWGEPFPIVWDPTGHHHPVEESVLPVRLPDMADYAPVESEDPQPLLAKASDWVQTTAGEAGVGGLPPETPVTRETNTMPGWAGSCWYFLRYCDPGNGDRFVGAEAERYWMQGMRRRARNWARAVWTCMWAGRSTPCCTSSMRGSGTRCCSTWGWSRRRSPSRSCSTRD
ncbi:MAG: leucine--tRNA ligase [Phycisphaerales bacterium]|nr:leucine--tRNA ligase [Phycisphaerales bacterium]